MERLIVIYQTQKDLDWQTDVANLLLTKYRCTLHSFAKLDPVDGWVEKDDRTVAIVEIKRRYVNRDTYPSIWISTRKRDALIDIAKGFPDARPLFIVYYDDSVCYIDVRNSGDMIVQGGRTDRGAVNDIEMMVDVPIGWLKGL